MLILFTTSFTLKTTEEPDYLETGEYFEDLIAEFFELDINKHEDYPDDEVWVYSITYPAYQGLEFAERMQRFCHEKQKQLMA
jgi:hypothetical protein